MTISRGIALVLLVSACDPTRRLADPPGGGAGGDPSQALSDSAVTYTPDTAFHQDDSGDVADTGDVHVGPIVLGAADDLTCMANGAALDCWGHNDLGQGMPPSGSFSRVAIGGKTACAIDAGDGHIACWGDSTGGRTSPPAGAFLTLSIGASGACAVKNDHTVSCWGGAVSPGDSIGTADRVAVGNGFTCVLKTDGASVVCFGSGPAVSQAPTSGAYTDLVAGDNFACALDVSGFLRCWGSGATTPPSGKFSALAASATSACAISSGDVSCWGPSAAALQPPAGTALTSLAIGRAHGCGTTAGGDVRCWGDDKYFQASAPEHDADSLVMALGVNGVDGGEYGCIIRSSDHRVDCFGSPNMLAPDVGLTAAGIVLARNHACALSLTGGISCWGNDIGGSLTPPAAVTSWDAVGLTDNASCGIRTSDKAYVCWGQGYGTSPQAVGSFVSIVSGDWHTCALSTTGSASCVGGGGAGQTTVPSGHHFTALGAGAALACGVDDDGELVCWGDNGAGRVTSAPSGTFKSVDAGTDQACAVRSDDSAVCWGTDQSGEATAPSGKFASVASGNHVSCGVRLNGDVSCWGDRVR